MAVADSSPSNRYNVILEEEDARGGHIRDHIGKTDEEMKDILSRRVYRSSNLFGLTIVIFDKLFGSFDNRNSATELINQTLNSNLQRVDRITEGISRREEIDMTFDGVTGREAFTSNPRLRPAVRTTDSVRVVIVPDPGRDKGYRVLTAFPKNIRN
ncbi:MAG: hypothetical protein K2X10_04820 [Hyphomicrobiales bacterium]|nr:hypothetical protein [Hyphomicrobiales bacterium]